MTQHPRHTRLLLALPCLLALANLMPSLAADGRMAIAKATYEKSIKEIQDRSQEKIRRWPADYVAELKNLQSRMQKEGNLDGWGAAKKEVDRFEKDKKITDSDLAADPAELKTIQVAFKDMGNQAILQRDRDILKLFAKYDTYLDGLKKDLTKAGRFDEATAVSDEMKRVKSSPEVTSAEFALAALDAWKPEKPAPEEPGENKAPPPDDGDKTVYPVATPAGAKIYGPGRKADNLNDLALKRGSFTDTENTPVGKPIRANLWTGSSGTRQQIRLAINTADTELSAVNMTVVVEAYAKYDNKQQKRLDPFVWEVQHIVVPRVQNQWNFIDCRPVDIPSYADLHGIIVSAFSEGKKLEFQGAYPPNVKSLAKPDLQPERSSGAPPFHRRRD